MLVTEATFVEIGSALLGVARLVDSDDRATAVDLVERLETLATFRFSTWAEASDDLNAADRVTSGNRIKLELVRSLLRCLTEPDITALRAIVMRQAPELAGRLDAACVASTLRLEEFIRFALFLLDEQSDDNDPAFDLPYPDVSPGPSVALKL